MIDNLVKYFAKKFHFPYLLYNIFCVQLFGCNILTGEILLLTFFFTHSPNLLIIQKEVRV